MSTWGARDSEAMADALTGAAERTEAVGAWVAGLGDAAGAAWYAQRGAKLRGMARAVEELPVSEEK